MKLKSLLKPIPSIDPLLGITPIFAERLKEGSRVRIGTNTLTVKDLKLNENKYVLTTQDKSGIIYKTAINVARRQNNLSPVQREQIKQNIKGVIKEYKEHPKRLTQMAENYYINFTEINNYPRFITRRLLRNFPPDVLREAGIKL